MRLFASEGWLRQQRRRARWQRRLRGESPAVHYFHQADDPYSHLVVQKLDALRSAYAIDFHIHLVSGPDRPFQGSSDLFRVGHCVMHSALPPITAPSCRETPIPTQHG
ncbi:MAG: hypothetical protein R3E84_04615 [Pseudomonadales bacterium]